MTSSHIFFIPGMIMIGMFVGFLLGARATRNQMELQRRRESERDAARAARAAKRAEKAPEKPEEPAAVVAEPEAEAARPDVPVTKPGKRKSKA